MIIVNLCLLSVSSIKILISNVTVMKKFNPFDNKKHSNNNHSIVLNTNKAASIYYVRYFFDFFDTPTPCQNFCLKNFFSDVINECSHLINH